MTKYKITKETIDGYRNTLAELQMKTLDDPKPRNYRKEGSMRLEYALMLNAGANGDRVLLSQAREQIQLASIAFKEAGMTRQYQEALNLLEGHRITLGKNVEKVDIMFRAVYKSGGVQDNLPLSDALVEPCKELEIVPVCSYNSGIETRETMPLGYDPKKELLKPWTMVNSIAVPTSISVTNECHQDYEHLEHQWTSLVWELVKTADEVMKGETDKLKVKILYTLAEQLDIVGKSYQGYIDDIDKSGREKDTLELIEGEGLDIIVKGAVEDIKDTAN